MPSNIEYICEGTGEVVLLLHGWGQNKEMMKPLIDDLKYKYKCVVIDLPGFGNSQFNQSKNVTEYTEKIRMFLEQNDILPSYIIGHSFGGKVAVEYYLKYKDLKKMIIIASPVLKPKRSVKYFYKIYKYKLLKKLSVKVDGGSSDYKNCPKEIKSFFVSVVNTHYNKQIKEIDIPVLLLWGNEDKQVPLNKGKQMNKILKNSHLQVLKGGHFAYLQNIDFARLLINKFIKEVKRD